MSKLHLAAVLLAATPVLAQQSGVSHPPESAVEDSASVSTVPAITPRVPVVSAPVLVMSATTGDVATGLPATEPTAANDSPAVTLHHRDIAKFDPDSRVVGDDAVEDPGAVAAGTLIRARLQTLIQTATTQPGTPFRAEVSEPVMHDGRVVVPAGAVLEGAVTDIRGGRRVHGAALIHLQAQSIVLPDGTRMPVHASVIDTDRYDDTRIDSEGNIVRRDHAKQTFAEFSLAAGSAAAAGGLIAGVPGALVGAGVGAGVGTIMWLKADRQTQLPPDTTVVLALESPLTIRPLVREPQYSAVPAALQAVPVERQAPAPEPQAFVPLQ